MIVVETSAPAETEALGAELAKGLRAGDVVLVQGDLGAGKTTLVRGAARGLGVTDPVTSPTFAIGHRYRGADVTVAHLDLYRLASLAHEDPGLLEDYLGPDRVAFIEWPEAAGAELDAATVRVTLAHAGGDRRRIEVSDERASDERASDERAPDELASDERASDECASDERASEECDLDDGTAEERTSEERNFDDGIAEERVSADGDASDGHAPGGDIGLGEARGS